MSRSVDHRASFAYPLDRVFAALTAKDEIELRLTRIGGTDAALLEHTASDGAVKLALRQGVPSEKLPSVVRSLHSGDLMVHREQAWQQADGAATATHKATVSGIPGAISGTSTLKPTADGCELVVTGEVSVNIPLVGGKIEKVIAEQVLRLLRKEDGFVNGRLDGTIH